MQFFILNPVRAYTYWPYDPKYMEYLEKELTYTNSSISHLIKRHYSNTWFRSKNPEGWEAHLETLKKKLKHTLIYTHEKQIFIRPGSLAYLNPPIEIINRIQYPILKPIPWAKPLPFQLHPYQEESWQRLLKAKHGNVELCTGCHAKGQGILMFDGSIKNVEDIKVGDQLMGPDSTPRKVLKLFRGRQQMAKITSQCGESFVVNLDHILSLKRTNRKSEYNIEKKRRKDFKGTNPIVNISVRDYLEKGQNFKHVNKLYKVPINFQEQKETLPLDPYILGSWLGDGDSADTAITSMDKEILDYWTNFAIKNNHKIRIEHQKKTKAVGLHIHNNWNNDIKKIFKSLNLLNNKHIPKSYKIASRENRLQLLAGLIDTDGYCNRLRTLEITTVSKKLSEDILFLVRSLGFRATCNIKYAGCQTGVIGMYYRIYISGNNLNEIPVKLERKKIKSDISRDPLRSNFDIELLEEDDYYGFALDGDHLYVLDNFIVTHNSGKSAIILKLCREAGLKTVIITPSKSIFEELVEKFEYHFGKGKIGKFGAGKKILDKQITICINDSLVNVEPATNEWKFFQQKEMLIVDESHGIATETLDPVCHDLLGNVPYRFFFSGTQTRGDGSEKLLQSIIGPTVYSLTTKDAVDGGYISPHSYKIVKVQTSNKGFSSSDPLETKRLHFLKNQNIAAFAAKLANMEATTRKYQTLILVEELIQISMLKKLITVPLAIAHSETRADKLKELGLEKENPSKSVLKFNKGEAMVLIGTSCIATGTNIFPTHNTINWVGGASEIKTKQGVVGRSCRKSEHNPHKALVVPKEKSIIWDFDVYDVPALSRSLEDRLSYYRDSGSEIEYIKLK